MNAFVTSPLFFTSFKSSPTAPICFRNISSNSFRRPCPSHHLPHFIATATATASPSPPNNETETENGWAVTRKNITSLKVDLSSDPTLPGVHFEELPLITGSDLLRLVLQETPDSYVNEITRTLLGWLPLGDGDYDTTHVPSVWLDNYPDPKCPPDFIGSVDDYSPERDRPVKKAVQKLTRSIPQQYKQVLKEKLGPMGFNGWTIKDLTPNRTRRATVANFVIYWYCVHYPEHLWE